MATPDLRFPEFTGGMAKDKTIRFSNKSYEKE
jgi:hypothetical protein